MTVAPRRAWTPELTALLVEGVNSGLSPPKLAMTLGRTVSAVEARAWREGIIWGKLNTPASLRRNKRLRG